MKRNLQDFSAGLILLVMLVPAVVCVMLIEAILVARNWIVYGSAWGNWRDRI